MKALSTEPLQLQAAQERLRRTREKMPTSSPATRRTVYSNRSGRHAGLRQDAACACACCSARAICAASLDGTEEQRAYRAQCHTRITAMRCCVGVMWMSSSMYAFRTQMMTSGIIIMCSMPKNLPSVAGSPWRDGHSLRFAGKHLRRSLDVGMSCM